MTYLKEVIYEECSGESGTHSEEQSRDGSAAFHMNHGQQTGEVALSGSSKEQSVTDRDAIIQLLHVQYLSLQYIHTFYDENEILERGLR